MTPAPDRLSPEHAEFDALVDAHDASVERAQMGYIEDTSGLFVFNAQTLKVRALWKSPHRKQHRHLQARRKALC